MEQDKHIIPTQRNLDGMYFNIVRNGVHSYSCFTDLSLAERETVLANYTREQLYRMVNILADTIRKIGEETNVRGIRK